MSLAKIRSSVSTSADVAGTALADGRLVALGTGAVAIDVSQDLSARVSGYLVGSGGSAVWQLAMMHSNAEGGAKGSVAAEYGEVTLIGEVTVTDAGAANASDKVITETNGRAATVTAFTPSTNYTTMLGFYGAPAAKVINGVLHLPHLGRADKLVAKLKTLTTATGAQLLVDSKMP